MYNESVLPSEIQPRFVEQVENIYIFEVATSLAYVPVQVTECQAYDKSGRKYDLSPLVRHDSGWHVTTTNADDKYIINVCHSVNNVTTSSCRSEFLLHSLHCFCWSALVRIKASYAMVAVVSPSVRCPSCGHISKTKQDRPIVTMEHY